MRPGKKTMNLIDVLPKLVLALAVCLVQTGANSDTRHPFAPNKEGI